MENPKIRKETKENLYNSNERTDKLNQSAITQTFFIFPKLPNNFLDFYMTTMQLSSLLHDRLPATHKQSQDSRLRVA